MVFKQLTILFFSNSWLFLKKHFQILFVLHFLFVLKCLQTKHIPVNYIWAKCLLANISNASVLK